MEAKPTVLEEALKGICATLLVSNEQQVIILTDAYGILPIFCYKSIHSYVYFSHFNDLIKVINTSELSPDKNGIWEALLYDSSIYKRTIFSEISHIPPGTHITIDLISGDIQMQKYSNLSFPAIQGIDSHQAGKSVAEKLKNAFAAQSNHKFLLPLSGGVDSRLLAAALVDVHGPECITALSFACKESSYELRYAKEVCDILGIKDWRPYILNSSSYMRSLDLFPGRLGGNLSISHGHLFNALCDKAESFIGMTLVSGAFADAAGGFHASPKTAASTSLEHSHYYQHLSSMAKIISLEDVFDPIHADIQSTYSSWKDGSSIETFDEYFYVTTRQPRVIFTQSLLYRDFLPVIQPFTNPELSSFMFGLPYSCRSFKESIRSAIAVLSPQLATLPDISSKMARKTASQSYHIYKGKILNNMARIATRAFFDKCLFFSPYQTECQDYNLRTTHRRSILSAFATLEKRKLISHDQTTVLSKKPYKQFGGGILPCVQYWALTISRTLDYFCIE